MSHANAPKHGAGFPPAVVDAFHAADRKAGTYIVGLLTSIFILAIIGYLFVCFWVTR
jgi:hypothetical protein